MKSMFNYLLQERYLSCDPLPNPENEKELTTFITLWKERKDTKLEDCIRRCQTAEDVIRDMQNIYGNALSNFNHDKVKWCQEYMDIMRNLIFEKYD